ncbi:MAG: pimeloyl-CoA dehydrogenase small subunit [Hyphomicrobiales bacterium]|nr:MAG: pimeloyl-CoA dehydrogenase small subunit [Hyphomicrobiales bacterium]
MDFKLNEDRRMLDETLTRFLADKYEITKRNEIAYSEAGHDAKIWQEIVELGIIGALFTEDEGGFSGEGFDIALVFEALGKALCPEPFLGALLAGKALAAGGAEHAAMLEDIVTGAKIGAVGFEEEASHYELAHVVTKATKTAGGYELDGVKSVVTHAQIADVIIISARLSGGVDDATGLALFAVPAGVDGLSIRDYNNVDGGRSGEVVLSKVKLAANALIAGGEAAFDLLETLAGYAHLALSAEGLGIMEVMKLQTLEFLKLRTQFGVPIGKFQVLQHRMVDLVLEIEQARSAVINAATLSDDAVVRGKNLSAAKLTIGETGHKVAEEAIQLHGGIGMTWEMPVSHYAKRLVMIDHQFGDEDYHLARYIELSKS